MDWKVVVSFVVGFANLLVASMLMAAGHWGDGMVSVGVAVFMFGVGLAVSER